MEYQHIDAFLPHMAWLGYTKSNQVLGSVLRSYTFPDSRFGCISIVSSVTTAVVKKQQTVIILINKVFLGIVKDLGRIFRTGNGC